MRGSREPAWHQGPAYDRLIALLLLQQQGPPWCAHESNCAQIRPSGKHMKNQLAGGAAGFNLLRDGNLNAHASVALLVVLGDDVLHRFDGELAFEQPAN